MNENCFNCIHIWAKISSVCSVYPTYNILKITKAVTWCAFQFQSRVMTLGIECNTDQDSFRNVDWKEILYHAWSLQEQSVPILFCTVKFTAMRTCKWQLDWHRIRLLFTLINCTPVRIVAILSELRSNLFLRAAKHEPVGYASRDKTRTKDQTNAELFSNSLTFWYCRRWKSWKKNRRFVFTSTTKAGC